MYNAICILYLWDITLFSHGVGVQYPGDTKYLLVYDVDEHWIALVVLQSEPTSVVRHHLLVR